MQAVDVDFPAPAARGPGPPPLSFDQERLWFLHQLQPQSSFYNLTALSCRLRGELVAGVLRQAVGQVVRRHEALRTVFPARDGRPEQAIAAAAEVQPPFLYVDLTALPAAGALPFAERAAAAVAALPFDLARGPLLRPVLFRAAAAEHVLLVVVHHIVFDGASIGILAAEISALYAALARRPAQEPPPPALEAVPELPELPQLPLQPADIAVWQRRQLDGEPLARLLGFWRRRLAGNPRLFELPLDRPRPAVQRFRGAVARLPLGPQLSREVRVLCSRQRVSPFMVLLAAFAALLARVGGSDDVPIATPVAGRDLPETEGMIGFFVNTLLLRIDAGNAGGAGEASTAGGGVEARGSGLGPSFAELVRRVREVCLEALDHQQLPFAKLVEDLEPRRDLSHNPLFQVLFSYNAGGAAAGGLTLPGVISEPLGLGVGAIAKFDLMLGCSESPAGISAHLEHNTDLFYSATAIRLLCGFERLLAAAVERPQTAVADLALLSPAERHQMLCEANDTRRAYPDAAAVHQLFAARARAAPDAVALAWGGGSLSYGELHRRSMRLACRLARRLAAGAGAEAPVGIFAERSPAAVEGMLAALFAGALYVPIDPAQPAERLAWLVRAAGLRAALGEERWRPAPAVFDGPWVALEPAAAAVRAANEAPACGGGGGDDALPRVDASALAYLMFTSGSTGQPKGIAIPHRAVVRLVHGADYVRFGADEVFLQLAPPAFDAATFEIWGALLHGARLAIPPPGVVGLGEIGDAVERHGVTTLWLTAGLFHQMVQEAPHRLRGVRQLLAGGDVLAPWHVRRAVAVRGAGAPLVNGYGPTEGTTFTSCQTIGDADLAEARVPIGRPIANTRVHLLGREGEPVPIGAPGEMAIGGDGLARGYWRQPAATAERFRPDPFAGPGEAGARLYASGDLARRLPDGRLDFLRRIDAQLKVRGYRIEPEEIEAAMAEHPAVAGAAVVVVRAGAGPGGAGGSKRLVACLAARPQRRRPRPRELRQFLRRRLPDYMLPAAFVWIAALPLTANGKVDRRAVAAGLDGVELGAAAGAPAAPRTASQRQLAAIWERVLGRGGIGVHDDFFDLGGDSLLAIQIVARAGQAGLPLTVEQVFRLPTVAELAAELDGGSMAAEAAGAAGAGGAADPTGAGDAGGSVGPSGAGDPIEARVPGGLGDPRGPDDPRRPARQAHRAEQGWVTGPVPLTPGQRWFFDRIAGSLTSAHAFSTCQLLELRRPLAAGALRRVVEHLCFQHDALRLRLHLGEGGWRQSSTGPEGLAGMVPCIDLGALDAAGQERALAAVAAALLAQPDIAGTPLARFVQLPRGSELPARLLVQLHHLVSDGASLRILLEDLEAAAEQAAGGAPAIRLPPKTTSFRRWAERQHQLAASAELRRQADDWLRLAGAAAHPLPVDGRATGAGAPPPDGGIEDVRMALDGAATRALVEELPAAHGFPFTHALLAAQARAFKRWSGAPALLLRQTDHGRNPPVAGIDLSHTVGWITTTAPVVLSLGDDEPAAEALAAIDEQLQSVPLRGLGYGLLRYLSDDPAIAERMAAIVSLPAATFNFLGRFDQDAAHGERWFVQAPLPLARRPPVPLTAPQLRLSGMVAGRPRQLHMVIHYARDLYRRATVERLAAHLEAELRRLLD